MIKNIIKLLFGYSIPNQRKDWFKTILINYVALGFRGVHYLPIIVYKNTKIYNIGKIRFECPLSKGLLTIGHLDIKSQGCTKFDNHGTITISGPVKIEGCCNIVNKGEIILKGNNRISDGSLLNIRERLEIGEETGIGFHSVIMDTDDHFSIDVNSKEIANISKPIIIGRSNFIGFRTIIKKGTITPDYLVVASANSLLSKDYSSLPPFTVIGGLPAKVLKSGIRRIFNRRREIELFDYFNANRQEQAVSLLKFGTDDIDTFCKRDNKLF